MTSKISPGWIGSSSYVVPINVGALACTTFRDFIVIGGLTTNRYAIRWCSIGDPTDWPEPATDDARAKQAGQESFPSEHGYVTALAGNDFYMYIFQENAISKGTYVGGDIVISVDIFEEDRGCVRGGRLVQVDDMVFFESDRGFHMLLNDQITDIGYGKVDDSYGG